MSHSPTGAVLRIALVLAIAVGCVPPRPAKVPSSSEGAVAFIVPSSVRVTRGGIAVDVWLRGFHSEFLREAILGVALTTPKGVVTREIRCPRTGAKDTYYCSTYSESAGDLRGGPATFKDLQPVAGKYALAVGVAGKVLAVHEFSVVPIATTGGATSPQVDPVTTAGKLYASPYERLGASGLVAYVPVDGRARGQWFVRFVWYRDGKRVSFDDQLAYSGYAYVPQDGKDPDFDSPVLKAIPFLVAPPTDPHGQLTLIALLNGDKPLGSWTFSIDPQGGGFVGTPYPTAPALGADQPWTFFGTVDGSIPEPALLTDARRIPPPDVAGFGASLEAEARVCAMAFDPKARPLLDEIALATQAAFYSMGDVLKVENTATREARAQAFAKHARTNLTDREVEAASRVAGQRLAGADLGGAARRLAALEAKLTAMSRKFRPGCLRELLGAAGTVVTK